MRQNWQHVVQKYLLPYKPTPERYMDFIKGTTYALQENFISCIHQTREELVYDVVKQFSSCMFTNLTRSAIKIPDEAKDLPCLCGKSGKCQRSHLVPRPDLVDLATRFAAFSGILCNRLKFEKNLQKLTLGIDDCVALTVANRDRECKLTPSPSPSPVIMISMCVCVYVCVFARVHEYTCVCAYICVCMCMCVCVSEQVNVTRQVTNLLQRFLNKEPCSTVQAGAPLDEQTRDEPKNQLELLNGRLMEVQNALVWFKGLQEHSVVHGVNFPHLQRLYLRLHTIPNVLILECQDCNKDRKPKRSEDESISAP